MAVQGSSARVEDGEEGVEVTAGVDSPPRRVSSPLGRSTVDVKTGELNWEPEQVREYHRP